ncbi:MAG: hypothetical protein KAT91_02955 [Candidatus Aenigmarchaeota archaeon]|nr:hypothetical protein [Candidatus Aenigmarchaeota archaeon]
MFKYVLPLSAVGAAAGFIAGAVSTETYLAQSSLENLISTQAPLINTQLPDTLTLHALVDTTCALSGALIAGVSSSFAEMYANIRNNSIYE